MEGGGGEYFSTHEGKKKVLNNHLLKKVQMNIPSVPIPTSDILSGTVSCENTENLTRFTGET